MSEGLSNRDETELVNPELGIEKKVAALEQMNADHIKDKENFFGATQPEASEQKEKDIVLPPNERLREKLDNKLIEYNSRQKEKDRDKYSKQDAHYKEAVLGRLLHNGSINRTELFNEMLKKEGQPFNEVTFNNAIETIAHYVLTKGESLVKKEEGAPIGAPAEKTPVPRQVTQGTGEEVIKKDREIESAGGGYGKESSLDDQGAGMIMRNELARISKEAAERATAEAGRIAAEKVKEVESARTELPEALKNLNEVRGRKDKTGEASIMERAEALYETATEKKLKDEAEVRA